VLQACLPQTDKRKTPENNILRGKRWARSDGSTSTPTGTWVRWPDKISFAQEVELRGGLVTL
jgi:hypothetical protein